MTLPVRQALGIADVEHIIIELTFESSRFGAGMVPHLQLRFVKHEVPTPQKSIEPLIDLEPDTVDTESTNAPTSLGADDQPSPPPDPLETSDSESEDDPLGSLKFKQQVVNTVAYQFANIAKKKLTDDWPETQNATWKQAREWIPQLHNYLETRLTKLGDYCVICDDVQPVSGADLCLYVLQPALHPSRSLRLFCPAQRAAQCSVFFLSSCRSGLHNSSSTKCHRKIVRMQIIIST